MNNKQQIVGIQQLTREQNASAPFFSIIIPVYNVAPYLRECLNSILAQAYPNWECLCVDDGSTDGSGAILDEYAQKGPRFRVFHKENGGVSSARNLALDHARGEWIWFVDSDDAIHPKALTWLEGGIKKHPQISSISFNAIVAPTLTNANWQDLPPLASLVPENRIDSKALKAHRRAGWSTILRKGTTRFEPYTIGEDVLFQLTEYWNNPCCIITNSQIYFYRIREESAVRGKVSLRKVKDFFETEIKLAQLFIKNHNQWDINNCIEYFQWNRDFVWFTFYFMFNALPLSEMKKVIPLWCDVQELQFSLLPESIKRRAICWMIQKTNSPLLCKTLVFGKINAKRILRNVLFSLGLLNFLKKIRKVLLTHA